MAFFLNKRKHFCVRKHLLKQRLDNTWQMTINEKKFIETALLYDLRIDGVVHLITGMWRSSLAGEYLLHHFLKH